MHDGNCVKVQAGVPATDKLFAAMQAYDPVTETQKAFYASAVDNQIVALRRNRISASDSSLPTTFFLRTQTLGLDLALVSIVSIVIAGGLLTVILLEYPFSGSVSVSSEPFVTGRLRGSSPASIRSTGARTARRKPGGVRRRAG